MTTTHYLVRHGNAGQRAKWTRPDELRPLTSSGRSQAEGLVALLWEADIMKILSSPYVRCVETVEPLAVVSGLPIDPTDLLAEGAGDRALEIILDPTTPPAVLCTHGDVISDVMGTLLDRGVPLQSRVGGEIGCEKGSTWILDVDGGRVVSARYEPPRMGVDGPANNATKSAANRRGVR